MERRQGRRFNLALPVRLKHGKGITRDISRSGIFLETEEARAIGETIDMSVDFGDGTVHCAGRVVRVEKLDGRFGIAAELQDIAFNETG